MTNVTYGKDYWSVSVLHTLPKSERRARYDELGAAGLIQRFQTQKAATEAVVAAGIDPAASWVRIMKSTPTYGIL
jgi:hypothetical protein